jgi:hypothetical protein
MEEAMIRSIRPSVPAALVGAALAAVLAVGAVAASDSGAKVLDASMAGIPASMAGQSFMGVQGGGLPWSIESGEAKLFRDGRLHVEVEGLILAAGPAAGRNPIATGVAIVSCGGTVVAQSAPVPYSTAGDAQVDARVTLPASCLAPVVFFAGVTGNGPRWFAVTGW